MEGIKQVVVICGLVRDKIELARLQHKETEEDAKRDIEADMIRFIQVYQARPIHAVFSSCDHGVAIAAVLAHKLSLPCSDPATFLRTHHKYYQRLQLAAAVPEAVPKMIMDPSSPDLSGRPFPFFMKPVKSVLSSHAYKISCEEVKSPHPPVTFLREFFKVVKMAAGDIEYDCCKTLCEDLICGEQFTVDGFVYGGEVVILGIVDSIMYPGTMSFASFEYPSKLPVGVQEKVKEISIRAIKGLGLTNTTFNIEYFYNSAIDDLKIIEVNPRFSGQFGDIYEKVDGTNTYDAAVGIACQETPSFSPRSGKYSVAASFVMRIFTNKQVKSVPSEQDIQKVTQLYPDAKVFVLLEDIQDSGSFRYCLVHLGANSFPELYAAYETCKGLLPFQLV